MANTNNPFGFRQFGQREGTAPTAGFSRYFISSGYTNPVFTGDLVARSSANPQYLISVGSTAGGAVNAITTLFEGVFLGCKYYNSNVGRTVWSSYYPGTGATGDVEAYVCSDPEQLYIVQGSTGGVLGSSVIGFMIPMSLTGSSQGSVLSGQSVMTVQSSLVTGLSTAGQFQIVDTYTNNAPPGVNGTSTTSEGWQIVVVQPNLATRRTLYGSQGLAPVST